MKDSIIKTVASSGRHVFTKVAGAIALGLMIGGLAGPEASGAEENGAPDASTVLDQYIEATGGKAAYEKLHNYVAKGRLIFVDMGFEGTFAYYHAEPNKLYMQIESDVIGNVERGVNGETAWYLADNTGARVEEGEERAASVLRAAFNGELHWRKYYGKVEYTGEEVIEGKACHRIVMTPNEGPPETRYFDKESHLLVRIRQSGSRAVEITLTDYRWVDGVLIPHRRDQVQQQCGGTLELAFVVESLQHNVDLPPTRFEPPVRVQAIALAKKAAEFVGQAVYGEPPAKLKQRKGACGGESSSERASSNGKNTENSSQQDNKTASTAGCCGGGS